MLDVAKGPDVKILNGQVNSNVIKAREVYEDADSLVLYGELVTDGAITYKIQATHDPDAAAPVWADLKDAAGAAVALPIQGEARIYGYGGGAMLMATGGLRVVASAPVTADRFWHMTKHYEIR